MTETLKTPASNDKVRSFLHGTGYHISSEPVSAGMESQVFRLFDERGEYIMRLNPSADGFRKDRYAEEHFSGCVPVPHVVEIGAFDGKLSYCITERAEGVTFQDADKRVMDALLPAVTETFCAIGVIDISATTGFGVFDSRTGNAPCRTWQEWLERVLAPEVYSWAAIRTLPAVDADLLDSAAEEFVRLLPACPEIRKLLHGDFGSNNLIVNGERVAAVLDWDCAGYGDPLYEVASAYFWSPWLMCMKKTWEVWKERFGNAPDFARRIRCYALRIGLVEVAENAFTPSGTLQWVQNRCGEILRQIEEG